MKKKSTTAISLIELIASITIVSISLTSVVLAYVQASKFPSFIVMNNAFNISNNYLNEILSKDFPTILPCPTPPPNRSNYTNVCDYNNLINLGAKDQHNNPIVGSENYNIYISVDTSSNAQLGTLVGSNSAKSSQIVRIDLKVTNNSMPDLLISAYKGKY